MTDSDIDLNGLRALLAVVRSGGFSAASRHLGIPANRLGRQVQRLEDTLGVRLLQRTTRKLSLTTAGLNLVERIEPAMQTLELGWRQVEAQADEACGHLRLATPMDFMNGGATHYLTQFLQQYPRITLEISLSDDQVDLFSSGIDAAFRAGPIHDENVVARRLIASRLYVVASPEFLALHGTPENAQSLAALPCLALRGKQGRTCWALTGPKGDINVDVHARLTVNGMGALVHAARAGLGVALVPDHLIAPDLAAGTLVNALPDHYHDGGGIYMVYSSRRHPPAALRALLDFMFAAADAAASARA